MVHKVSGSLPNQLVCHAKRWHVYTLTVFNVETFFCYQSQEDHNANLHWSGEGWR